MPVCWRFDSVTVDTATLRVVVNGVPHALEPKSFRLLQFLIEHRDRVVSKDEIFQAVWAGAFVTDNALTRAIAQVRKAIGDDSRERRYIETIPTVGYRFVASVQESAAPAVPVSDYAARIDLRLGVAAVVVAAVALGGWFWMRRLTPSDGSAREAFRPVQFSSSAGLDMGASFSPDGDLVAYASDRPGSFEIFVRSFDAGAHELQLTSDGNQNISPAFSPDGRWVAFASARRRGIFRVPAIGGLVQRLTDFGLHPVWSPDSQMIVFRSSGSASLSTTDYYWPAESSLWTVPATGGDPRQITGKNGPPTGGQSFPSFSPDGAEIRFVNNYKNEASVWAYRLADGSVRKLFGSTRFQYSDATFARDGTRMWFVNWQLNGDIGIWQLPLDASTLTPTGDAVALYPSPFAVPRDLALSADGKRLAFTAVLSSSAIMTQHLAGDSTPVGLTQETTYRYGIVRSTPDGSRAIYTSFPRNGLARQVLTAGDGSPPLSVGSTDADQYYGGVSADNGRAFFVEQRNDQLQIISQRFADGSSQHMTTLPPGAAQVAFSRDGTRVLFHNVLDERRQTFIQDTATGARRVIASGPEDVGFARFSRDDAWISLEISHRPKGGDDIAVMPASGGPLRVIMKSDLPSYSAGWMPDNDRILFAGFRDGTWNVFTVSRTTGKTEQLTSYTSMRTYVRYPDWMIGDRIVYEFNETKGNIFVAGLPR
jgi:Tol biopolymer transport system component/DNA-binding winged helix-turn-helix (wHTH) protein